MNYRRLGGGVGVIKVQQYDSILYGINSNSGTSSDDIKNRSLSKLVDLWMTPMLFFFFWHVYLLCLFLLGVKYFFFHRVFYLMMVNDENKWKQTIILDGLY